MADINKKSIKNTNCCVPQCHSRASKHENVSFHRFPPDGDKTTIKTSQDTKEVVERRKEWLRRLKIGKKVTKRMLVCSKHFRKEDFFPAVVKQGKARERPRLKNTALPSLNLPVSSTDKQEEKLKKKAAAEKRKERYKHRSYVWNNTEVKATGDVAAEKSDSATKNVDLSALEKETLDALLLLADSGGPSNDNNKENDQRFSNLYRTHNHEDQNINDQANENDHSSDTLNTMIYLDNNISPKLNYNNLNLKHLKTLTGIPNCAILDKLVSLLVMQESQATRILTVKEQVVMTLMRIKQNLKFSVLSIFFGVTRTTCKSVFVETIHNLKRILESCITMPSKEETIKNLPKCFSKLRNVRIVVDSTEIPIEKTKCLTCCINTYSVYKSCNTLKYMIFMSPDGIISHVSKGYGGRVSDKAIFNQSGILECLEPHVDAVLVDKGFLIEEECNNSYIELIRPPFAQKSKLSACDARRTRLIARARVHIERVIQRLKNFELLCGRVPWTLIPFLDDIMIVVCGIVNLSAPILADNKF